MGEYAHLRLGQLSWPDDDFGYPVFVFCRNRQGLLDAGVALHQLVARSYPDDVYSPLLQSVFFSHHRQGLSWSVGHLPHFHHDDAHRQRLLHSTQVISMLRMRPIWVYLFSKEPHDGLAARMNVQLFVNILNMDTNSVDADLELVSNFLIKGALG